MKQKKEMIDDERGYFFGFARGTYGEVLGELSRTPRFLAGIFEVVSCQGTAGGVERTAQIAIARVLQAAAVAG